MLIRAYTQRTSAQNVNTILRRASCAILYHSPSKARLQQRVYSTRSALSSAQDDLDASSPNDRLDRQLRNSTFNDDPPTHEFVTTNPGDAATQPATSATTSSNTLPVLRPPPPSPSQPHHSLNTFLSHARRTSISEISTTYLGTRYEYLVQTHLKSHFRFALSRIGGRGDSGIDLLGTWDLPAVITAAAQPQSDRKEPQTNGDESPMPSMPIPVLIQCKRLRLSSRGGPNLIRELEGSFRAAPIGWRSDSLGQSRTLGIMVCTQPATKGVREAMGRSTRGLMWWCIEEIDAPVSTSNADQALDKDDVEKAGEEEDHEGAEADTNLPPRLPTLRTRQILWNNAASVHCGLQGVDVGTVYAPDPSDDDGKEAVLLWKGSPLDFS